MRLLHVADSVIADGDVALPHRVGWIALEQFRGDIQGHPVGGCGCLQLALLLSGAVLTETTFNWPGIGHELIVYLENRDYAAVQGIIVVFALVVVAVSLVIDFVNAFIDPRIRY